MKIFENIKNGVLPDNNLILYLIDNKITDPKNKTDIKKHIEILSHALKNSTTQEKILLNKVLFVLERINDDPNYLDNFIFRTFTINNNDITDESYVEFLKRIFIKLNVCEVIQIINKKLEIIQYIDPKEMRSFFNWILHFLWGISSYHNNKDYALLYNNLINLIINLKKANRISEMMYVEFFTYHIMGNSFQKKDQWREFNKNITQKTITSYTQFLDKLPKPKNYNHKKKKIAFIKERIVFNSPYMVEYSLFKNLMENPEFTNNYELTIYSFNQFEKSFDDKNAINKLNSIGINVKTPVNYFVQDGYYNNHLDKALTLRQTLIDDEIDIMIAGGVFPIVNFLYTTRSAPLQIYYSHGNCAFDIPNIDKKISHFQQECNEFEWNIINVPLAKEFLVGTDGEKVVGEIIKNDYKQKFGNDVVILGTIGRLVKIDNDEYIETISKIMEKNPNTIYLACGDGNEKNIKEKLKKYNIDEKRFIFTGQVKPHVYGWIIDVWCDTFPLIQGQSRDEFMAKGNGVVVFGLNKQFREDRKNLLNNLYTKEEFELILPQNKKQYIENTNYILENKLYKTLNKKMQKDIEYIFNNRGKITLIDVLKGFK